MASKLRHDRRTQQLAAAGSLAALVIAVLVKRRAALDKVVPAALKTPGPLTTPQLEAAMRDLYEPIPGGGRILLVPTSRGRVARVEIHPTKEATLKRHAPQFAPSSTALDSRAPLTPGPNALKPPEGEGKRDRKVGVYVADSLLCSCR
jgi:ATP-binding cassette subfamily D (ALD) long-chain fatty acid import protein